VEVKILLACRLALLSLILVTASSAQELKVAAAADLSIAMEKVGALFTKQTGVVLKVSYGSSGHFYSEIRNGAPFDIFLSADRSYPDALDEAGKTDQKTTVYALGKLVLWISNKVGADPSVKDLAVLILPGVRKIAIANPEHAPYGRAAVAAMVHCTIYDRVKPKLVMGENVAQAAQFAESGNAEAAMIPLSLALSDRMKKSGRYALVAQDSYPPLFQAAVVLSSSQSKQQAHRFIEFLRSSTAQKILQENGFEAPRK